MAQTALAAAWPPLRYADWQPTIETLQRMTQIVGKIMLARAPEVNHWWHVTLRPTARGLTTRPMHAKGRTFEMRFDFLDHVLEIETSDGARRAVALAARPVAEFHAELMGALDAMDLHTRIWTRPQEVTEITPFDKDREHASYDREAVERFFRIVQQSTQVLRKFRGRFLGKSSPVHFFWGGFDLAVTRFSGRRAPPHPGGIPNLADWVTREAYSHEVASVGWWPGSEAYPDSAFYAYGYPEPVGCPREPVRPAGAIYHEPMREFLLPYEAMRTSSSPEDSLLAFCESTYEAVANTGGWDRAGLERSAT
jgi:hypothetical protein